MNTDQLILRETDNLPLINKDDVLTNADLDGNFIKIYNDLLSLCSAEDSTLIYDDVKSYIIGEYATYDGKLWLCTEDCTGVTPGSDITEWTDAFPTILAHQKNKDFILDEGGVYEVTAEEIRLFIDAGLTSTTNLTLTTKTATSFKIESSTGTDVILPQATVRDAGLLSADDKVKLENTTGINTGDQTLVSLNAEDVDNKVTDFTTINDTLYPTTQAVDTYLTAQVPTLVETFIDSGVEVTTNKTITFAVINDTLYPSVKAVDDQLDLKVDKVVGERLITSAEATVLSNTSGTNTGDQIISDATITTTDITTNNFTTAKHGFVPKGTNVGNFLKDDGTWGTPASGGLTYFTEAKNTTAPNATVPVDSLTAVTGTTDADFAIIPKGAGALTSQVSDGTTTGGNKRGARAVDFQRSRAAATQVASGTDSTILSGVNNVASNTYGVVLGGSGNLTSAQYTLAFGRNAYITGNYAFEFGNNGNGTADGGFGFLSAQTGSNAVSFHGAATGTNSFTKTGTASGLNSVAFSGTSSGAYSFTANASNLSNSRASSIFGELGSTKGVATRISLSCYQNISPYIAGNSQASIGAVTTQTTTNTAISLLTYNGTVISLPLQDNEAIRVRGSIIGKQTASVNVCCYDFDCVIVRGVGVATTVLKVNNMNLVFDDIVCTVLPTLNADTANGGLDIKSGGKVTTTIKWVARIDSTEVILA